MFQRILKKKNMYHVFHNIFHNIKQDNYFQD